MTSTRTLAAMAIFAIVSAGCGGDSSPVDPGTPVPATIAIQAGDQQQAAAGEAVAIPPAVIVRDAQGKPVPGATVSFSVTAGGGAVTGASQATNSAGVATVASWTLGPSGDQRLSAKVGSLPAVTFQAGIVPGTEQHVGSFGSGGGTLAISDPGSPYDGLTLTVPAGTVTGQTEWRLRVASGQPGLSLPAGFQVAGPAIEVSTDQARGGKLMTLEVPVDAGEDEMVFLALHDPLRGVTELLPTVKRTANSVVAMTTHLRGDLILGSEPVASSAAALPPGVAASEIAAVDVGAELIPVILEDIAEGLSVALNRWPVVDHGSFRFPGGMGLGISALQIVGSGGGYPSFEGAVRKLPIPGAYAESGPLAAVLIAQQKVATGLSEIMGDLTAALNESPARDELVLQNTIANMRVTGRAGMIAAMVNDAGRQTALAVSAIAGTAGGLTVVSPATEEPTQITLSAGGMFGSFSMPLIAPGNPLPVTNLVPLSSFVTPFVELRSIAGEIGKLGRTIEGPARDAINNQLATEARLAPIPVEIRHFQDDDWISTLTTRIVARRKTAQIRILGHTTTIHLPDGAEIARTEGAPISVDTLGLGAIGDAVGEVARTLSTFTAGVGGILQQISVSNSRLVLAPFEVEPAEVVIDTDDLVVELEAKVPHPPAEGFRIEWDWGDGEKTEALGLTTASHEYESVGGYQVIATLMTSAARTRLAVDTVRVRRKAAVWVGSVYGQETSTVPGHLRTVYSEATDLRFEFAAEQDGIARFDLVEGQLKVWNEVPCADYISPVVAVDLASSDWPMWLLTSESNPETPGEPGPEGGPWYRGNASAGGLEVYNKVCPVSQSDNPEPYVFARSWLWFDTSSEAWTRSSDPRVMEGTFQSQNSPGVISQWTWRFERIDAE